MSSDTKKDNGFDKTQVDWTLYLITDPEMCRDRGVAETVEAAVRGGASAVQLRDKDATDEDLAKLAREIKAHLAEVGDKRPVPLIVNDRLEVAREVGIGLHLGQSDGSPVEAREALGDDAIIGLSVSTEDEIEAAVKDGVVDYFGIGPVWPTDTKQDAANALGTDRLNELIAATGSTPALAIGGIDMTRVLTLSQSGVAGFCVVSGICAADDPEDAAARLRSAYVSGTETFKRGVPK